MKKYGFVYVTVPDEKTAKEIAHQCIDQKLSACANIFPPHLSCYKWKGEKREEKEVVLILKTREDLFENLCSTIKSLHTYECPCIVFIPLSKGYLPFFSWMDSQLKDLASG